MTGRRLALVICALALAGVLPPLLLGAAQGVADATFQVNISGNGSGTVSGPDGVCSYNGSVKSGACSGVHPVGMGESDLAYSASASLGSDFLTWLGCDEEQGNLCRVKRDQVEDGETVIVTAVFETEGNPLTVTTSAGGKVTSPSGIDCGLGATDCSETLTPNAQVRLTATPMTGYHFVRWENDCASFLTTICDLVMNFSKTARAVFAQGPATFPLTALTPVGGEIESSPAGIHCGAGTKNLCLANFPANAQVQLTATPMAGYAFVRWEGDCATVEILVCVVVIDNATTVAAVFVKVTPKCKCKDLTVTAPKREFGSAEGIRPGLTLTRFFFSLEWTLRCTAGTGNKCKGTLTFDAPEGFKNVKTWRLVKVAGKTKRVLDPSPIACERACKLNQSTITNGTVRVNMDSNKTFDQLEGKSFEFKVTTKCSGEETTYVFTVAMGADGRIKTVKRSIEI